MFQLILLLITAAIAYASDGCSFSLAVSGGISGPVWQLQNGQLRVGNYYTAAKFQIDNGYVIDSNGSGCILTAAVSQFQCNEGENALQGFSIEENSVLLYNDNPLFYACPASETEWNIYTVPVARQLKCVAITINADNCGTSRQRILRHRYLPGFNSPPPEDFVSRFGAEFGVGPPIVESERPSSSGSPKKIKLPEFDALEFSMPDAGQGSVSRPTSEYNSPEIQYLAPDIDSASPIEYSTSPPSKSLREKLDLPKFDLSNFFEQAASALKASPPVKHHPIAKAAALIVPNMIGGVVGGMLANALPSLLPNNSHHGDKEGKETRVDELKTKPDEAVKTIAPAFSASKETAGPESKDTKSEGGTSNLAQPSKKIIPWNFRGAKKTLPLVTAATASVAVTTTTTTTAPSGFKTEFRTSDAVGGTINAKF